MSDMAQRLRDGADRFLKWAHKQQYSGPPVISIPVHDGNIDRLMEDAAKLIEWQAAEIVNMRSALATAREEGRLEGLEEASTRLDAAQKRHADRFKEDFRVQHGFAADVLQHEASAIRALKEKQP